MALFQKTSQTSSSTPLYTLGLQKNLLIAGLGNPGQEYNHTRHNIGFEILDNFAQKLDFPGWIEKKDLKCLISTKTIGDTRVILVKPTTFMNLSGNALSLVSNFYKIPVDQIIVVHDELDIPFGQIRSRLGGSHAGHNGIKSVIEHLGQNFGRLRIGINNEQTINLASESFVLAKFNSSELEKINHLLTEATELLNEYVNGQPITNDTRTFIDI